MDRNRNLEKQPNNPLHGVRLVEIMEFLIKKFGWKELGSRIKIKCFTDNPSLSSSLKFLRKTQWARTKVEELYLSSFEKPVPKEKRKDTKDVPPSKDSNEEDYRNNKW